MVFDKLANVVTKHYKLIAVIWAILLICSIPAVMLVNDAVSYETDMSDSDNSESGRATSIINEEFSTSVANGTIIIVLQSDNMTTAEARDFVLALQNALEAKDLDYLESVSSIYSYSELVMYTGISQLGPEMYIVENEVNQMASVIYGIPAMYLQNWASNGYNDSVAYSTTYSQLNALLSASGEDESMVALAFGYYGAFTNAWNGTSSIADPAVRAAGAETLIHSVAYGMIASLPVDDSEKQVAGAVIGAFNMTTFNSGTMIHAFTMNVISSASGITNMTFLQTVYEMGPAYNTTAMSIYAQSIVENGTIDTYPIALPSALTTGFVSPNDKTMLMTLSFSIDAAYTDSDGNMPLLETVDEIRSVIGDVKDDTGYDVSTYVTGTAAISQDMKTSSADDLSLIEPITIFVIIVLMGYLFRTVIGQFLPLGAVGAAIGVTEALIYLMATYVMDVNYMINTIVFSMMMAIGTDYSIFIITRYREERMKGATREQAVHTSINWAGESVVTSGLTVIVSLMAMATADYSFVKSMGIIMTGAIFIALMVALTLIPSILMLVGNKMFWPTTGKRWDNYVAKFKAKRESGKHGYFHKAATFSVHHSKVVLALAIVLTIPTTYMFIAADTSFDFIGAMGDSESIDGMTAMSEDFGAGAIMPTQIVIVGDTVVYDGTSWNYTYLNAVENITKTIAAEDQVSKVSSITRPYGEIFDYRNLTTMSAEEQTTYTSAMLGFLGNDTKSVMFTVVLTDEPQSSDAVNFIPELRDDLGNAMDAQPAMSGSDILVGGTTASLYDTSKSTGAEFTNIEILVIIGIFLVLMIVLGSLLLPAFAIVSIAMSITWSFTLTYLVFGTWLGLPVLWLIPLILFVLLMGIGMDYNVFILTRIREEIHKGAPIKEAVVTAADWTGGIITALALIMAGAFGAMMLSSNAMLQEFGFALTVAVLMDAMIVRTYIVPAALTVMGKKAWWAPGRLQRVGREEKMAKKDEQPKN